MTIRAAFPVVSAGVVILMLLSAGPLRAQDGTESDPGSALAAALSAACRANEPHFANYLTQQNTAAFKALPADQRTSLLQRFSLVSEAGKPLLDSDPQNHIILRCQTPESTTEFRFGDPRVHENLAFIPVNVVDGQQTQFGLVRENGGWRLISLGLVLLDIPQLSKQWADSDLAAHEDAAVATLRGLADAIQTYHRAYGKLPDSLTQLGPAPKDQISPEQASLVNEHLAAGSTAGYRFRYRIVSSSEEQNQTFELAAVPEAYGKTGRRSFFMDAAGKIHAADKHGELATADDSLVAQSP
ncbi:MAG TPA: hypothetical protein VIY66_07750 [Candidatus Acidoferrales bacterium]